jgi:RNA polymerase sigma factor (sigma-70 family)
VPAGDALHRRNRATSAPVPAAVPDRERFEAAFETNHRRVLAYALRRVATESDAEDVVADTFAVAWRRVDRLPETDALPWLLAVARRVAANHRRGTDRRSRLTVRLRREPVVSLSPHDSPALDTLATLGADDQELLRLLAWDDLTQAEAGIVLGITANAVAIRLHRAKKRFAAALAKGSGASRTSEGSEGQIPGRRHEEPTP